VTQLGGYYQQGVVFRLAPGKSGWTEQVLYDFTGGADGGQPDSVLTFGLSALFGIAGAQSGGHGPIFEITAK
jgi:hypothetical protein